jgi:hypothetical protein
MPDGADETKKAKAELAAAKAKAKAMRPWYAKKRFILPLGLFVIFTFSNSLNGGEGEPNSTVTPGTSETETEETSEAKIDVTTLEGLKAAISSQLGEVTNMEVPRNLDVTLSDGDLYVMYALDENLTNNLLIVGAWGDVSDIVKLVQDSGLSKNLTVNGTVALIDANGNELGQQIVFTANFLDDKVPLLNTENLIGKEMWENASSSFIYHPAIRDE